MGILADKIRLITTVIFDVDGVLSDGKITYDVHGVEYKNFHVRDGHRITLLHRTGYHTGIITGRSTPIVDHRAKELGIHWLYQGAKDKLEVYEQLKAEHALCDSEIAYIGDDYIDLPVLARVGFAACVPEAPQEVRESVQYVTQATGGNGAVAEFIELILRHAGHWEQIMERYRR
ncbi:KdsC family phosphatase [Chrysiogenes arsenatis]|uniref:KdsC family phosphatase n=1 Tax=Chrysiogenes arsenatis TaxID=309797 RepID=UPI00041EAA57|nr:HAD-IIIA family hydrolase [Chrysiogenes arsenatis]